MVVLGGNQKHKWGGGSTEVEHDPIYQKYHKNDDIAGQFMKEDSVRDVCVLDEGYFSKHKKRSKKFLVQFLKKLKKML